MPQANAVTILGTERHSLISKSTGKTYDISIALPYAYLNDPSGGGPFYKTLDLWQTIYLTDANWHFNMVTDFVREAAWCGRSYDAIIVGIGYPEGATPQESWRINSIQRSHDLTPMRLVKDEEEGSAWIARQIQTGGGDAFFTFLTDELTPWVEQNYRADPAGRIFVGHSYGGLFALYSMFRTPELFRSYIAASPHLRDAASSIFDMEQSFASQRSDLHAQLYLAAGELENSEEDPTLRDMQRMASILAARNYPNLTLNTAIFPDNNHCEVAAPALHAGLKMALKK